QGFPMLATARQTGSLRLPAERRRSEARGPRPPGLAPSSLFGVAWGNRCTPDGLAPPLGGASTPSPRLSTPAPTEQRPFSQNAYTCKGADPPEHGKALP